MVNRHKLEVPHKFGLSFDKTSWFAQLHGIARTTNNRTFRDLSKDHGQRTHNPLMLQLQNRYYNSVLSEWLFRYDYPHYFRAWDWDNQCSDFYQTRSGKLHSPRSVLTAGEGSYVEDLYPPLPPPLSNREKNAIKKFRRDGYYKIQDWFNWDSELHNEAHSESEAEIKKLYQLLEKTVDSDKSSRRWGTDGFLSRTILSKLLDDPRSILRKLVHGYLQDSDVRFTGIQLHILEGGKKAPTYEEYGNGAWHWDGCGTRLCLDLHDRRKQRTGKPCLCYPNIQRQSQNHVAQGIRSVRKK